MNNEAPRRKYTSWCLLLEIGHLFESVKKMKKKVMILFLGLLCFSIGLTGCKDAEKEKAVAEAAEAKSELTKVKGVLEETQIERDTLKAKVVEVSESLQMAQTKIDSLLEINNQAGDMKDKVADLTRERDAEITKTAEAQTLVETLKSQLQEQILKVTGLEGQNQKLQDTIELLKKQLGSDAKATELPKL